MLMYYCAYALYVAVENRYRLLDGEFLQKVYGQSVGQSTLALSIFFGLVMVGRLVGSFFVERFGYLQSILLLRWLPVACIGLSLFGPAQFIWLLPASGFFLSIIFPTLTASVSSTYLSNINSLLGLLFTTQGSWDFWPLACGYSQRPGRNKIRFQPEPGLYPAHSASAFVLLRLQTQKAARTGESQGQ